jgi:NAD(P)-dependent dehydrogenase (short-subunit alcohol dehydrogenase family)
MKDKVILITGGTSGIGKAAAMELARQGAGVVITSRDRIKGENTINQIRVSTGNKSVQMLEVDLASLESVRNLAGNFRKDFNRLDVLVNNAGVMYGQRKITLEGYEYTFCVNHLSHFLLTNLLNDMLLSSSARIINVSSQFQRSGRINFEDLMLEKKYTGFRAYSQSKLANIIFTYELARRWGDKGITANAMHPGAVRTNFGTEAAPLFKFLLMLGKPILKSPEKGADTIVYLASSLLVEGATGKYFINRREQRSNSISYDPAIGKRLWEVSEKLTGIQ